MAFIDGNDGENFMTEGLIELWDLLDDESRKEDKMTEQQLKQGQELKRIIATLESELDKINGKNKPVQGINVFIPNVGSLISDVGEVYEKHLAMYNKKFKDL